MAFSESQCCSLRVCSGMASSHTTPRLGPSSAISVADETKFDFICISTPPRTRGHFRYNMAGSPGRHSSRWNSERQPKGSQLASEPCFQAQPPSFARLPIRRMDEQDSSRLITAEISVLIRPSVREQTEAINLDGICLECFPDGVASPGLQERRWGNEWSSGRD